jgi:hypothetical protein
MSPFAQDLAKIPKKKPTALPESATTVRTPTPVSSTSPGTVPNTSGTTAAIEKAKRQWSTATPKQKEELGLAIRRNQENLQREKTNLRSSVSPTSTRPNSVPVGRRGEPIQVKRGTNKPGSIGGRNYTGHAFDQMQGRGIPSSAVENAIKLGRKTPDQLPGLTRHFDEVNGLLVVTKVDGTVVTVITRKSKSMK